jgi:hypothetical protein
LRADLRKEGLAVIASGIHKGEKDACLSYLVG